MTTSDRSVIRLSALLVGAVALVSVAVQAFSYALVEFVVFDGVLGPPDSTAASVAMDATGVLDALGTRVVPVIAVVLAFYLTAGRDLPAAPCLAGAFVGSLVAVAGHPLAVWLLVDAPAFALEPLARESLRWVARLVVPVLAAVALGAVVDDLWDRGARWRGAGS